MSISYIESGIEKIELEGHLCAIIIRADYVNDGIKFFTTSDMSQQLGYMRRPKGYVIEPHIHNPLERSVFFTQETLFIRSGVVRIDFYSHAQQLLESSILNARDVILLIRGGHGFEIIEEAEIIEVKQGPYAGDDDKTRFTSTARL